MHFDVSSEESSCLYAIPANLVARHLCFDLTLGRKKCPDGQKVNIQSRGVFGRISRAYSRRIYLLKQSYWGRYTA